MADIILKVEPQQIISKASEFQTCRGNISNLMDEVKNNINSIKDGFDSEAGQTFLTKFNNCYDDINNMLAIMDSYIKSLNDVANIMTNAEKSAASVAEALPVDGVFAK